MVVVRVREALKGVFTTGPTLARDGGGVLNRPVPRSRSSPKRQASSLTLHLSRSNACHQLEGTYSPPARRMPNRPLRLARDCARESLRYRIYSSLQNDRRFAREQKKKGPTFLLR